MTWNYDSNTRTLIFEGQGAIERGEYEQYQDNVWYIEIQNGITSIGSGAFEQFSSLKSVIIPESVTSIGRYAFADCWNLSTINIPEGVTTIEEGVFYECKNLKSMHIPDSVTSIGAYAFSDCTSLTSINIPEGVTSIGEQAFNCCEDLTNVMIPDSVTSIGAYAFADCTSLTSINIPDSVITSIGEGTFLRCSSLTSINIPYTVTKISDYAFSGCENLKEIIYEGSSQDWNKIQIGTDNEALYEATIYYDNENPPPDEDGDNDNEWSYDSNTKTLIFEGQGAIERGEYEQYKNDVLYIEIKNGITSIGDYAFEEFLNLKSINIPDSVTSIGRYAFSTCASLTNITIPTGVTTIEEGVFDYCEDLTSINIPDSVISIGRYAFDFCTSLTIITIPEKVTSIEEDAFLGCENLKEIIYEGSSQDWNKIQIETGNEALYEATIYYGKENPPDGESNFPYEKNSFWFSNNYATNKTDTFMYLGDLPFELKKEQGSNTPISENVSISGEDNVVGCRGFKILSCEQIGTTTGKYFLNSVEGLCVGDIYSVYFSSYYIDLGEITSIDTNEKSIIVTNFKNEMNDNPNDNILFIVSKPFLGTEDIGQLASASGVNNFALLMGASAEGKLTKAIGRFSKTRGLRTISKGYGSSADGAGLIATRNYQRVAGTYNIEDTEEKYLDIVGNGQNDSKRSNAYTLDEDGNGWYAGNLDVTKGINAERLTIKDNISANHITVKNKVSANDIVIKNGINGKAKFNYNYTPTKEITFEGKYRKAEENNIEFPIMNGYVNFWNYGNLFIKELQNIALRATENYYDTIEIKEGKIYHEKRILELDLTGLEWGLSTTNIYILKLNDILGDKWSEYGKKCLREGYAIASFGEYIGKWSGSTGIFSNNSELAIQQSSSGIYVRMYYADENVKDADTFNQYIRNLEASGNPMKLYVVLNDDLIETTEWITEYSEFIQTYFKNENTNTYLCTTNYGDISGIIQKENDIDIIEELATLRADINKRIKYISNDKESVNSANIILSSNCERRLGELSSLILSMPDTIDERYESYFTFSSGETPTTLTYSSTPIRWSGDDVDYDGVFIPEANKIYEVAIKYLGDDAEGNPIISARVGVV